MRSCIYKFLDVNKEVIYVGKAKDLKARLSCHRHLPIDCYKNISYVQYITIKDENTLDFIECYFIQKYRPIYNSKFNKGEEVFSIEELDKKRWSFYRDFDKHITIPSIEKIKDAEELENSYYRKLVDEASSSFLIL